MDYNLEECVKIHSLTRGADAGSVLSLARLCAADERLRCLEDLTEEAAGELICTLKLLNVDHRKEAERWMERVA